MAFFAQSTFDSFTSFKEAEFHDDAEFGAFHVIRAFELSRCAFAKPPSFNQADFKQAPDLDDVRLPLPGFWRAGNAELIAKYRAMRRMAIQGADYEREQMAFKGEIRSRRWTRDKFWHPSLWLGLIYDGAADCGRSIVRPFLIWGAATFIFALVYLRLGIESGEAWRACLANGDSPWAKALILSFRNALVLFSGTRDARITQTYQCLFGGANGEPKIPDSVTFIESIAQVPLSAVLIFLFLLAVRNQFKIK